MNLREKYKKEVMPHTLEIERDLEHARKAGDIERVARCLRFLITSELPVMPTEEELKEMQEELKEVRAGKSESTLDQATGVAMWLMYLNLFNPGSEHISRTDETLMQEALDGYRKELDGASDAVVRSCVHRSAELVYLAGELDVELDITAFPEFERNDIEADVVNKKMLYRRKNRS